MEYASILCLYVLKAALPFIKPAKKTPPQADQSAKPSTVPQSDPMAVPSAVLSHLCGLLDSPDTDAVVRRAAQDIIVEGVVIFFPDSNARKEYLLSMIGAVLVSWLCSCINNIKLVSSQPVVLNLGQFLKVRCIQSECRMITSCLKPDLPAELIKTSTSCSAQDSPPTYTYIR